MRETELDERVIRCVEGIARCSLRGFCVRCPAYCRTCDMMGIVALNAHKHAHTGMCKVHHPWMVVFLPEVRDQAIAYCSSKAFCTCS